MAREAQTAINHHLHQYWSALTVTKRGIYKRIVRIKRKNIAIKGRTNSEGKLSQLHGMIQTPLPHHKARVTTIMNKPMYALWPKIMRLMI